MTGTLYQETRRRMAEAIAYGAELFERAGGQPHDDVPDGDGSIEEFQAEELMQQFGLRWEHHSDPTRHQHRLIGRWEDKPGPPPGEDEGGLKRD